MDVKAEAGGVEPALKKQRPELQEGAAAYNPAAAPAAVPGMPPPPSAAPAAAAVNGAAQLTSGGASSGVAGAGSVDKPPAPAITTPGPALAPATPLPALAPVKPRKKGVSVVCPIAYGSIAFWLGKKKADEFHTHKWTLLVRGPNGEDISYFVRKVVFTLHPSFAEPTRELTEYPFEVTEMGWGEFEAKITIHFKDPDERPVDVLHALRLYPDPSIQLTTKQPVVSERYDEVVFTDPTEEFFETLVKGPELLPQRHELQEHFTRFNDCEELQRLACARKYVHTKLREAKDKISKADISLAQLKSAPNAMPLVARK